MYNSVEVFVRKAVVAGTCGSFGFWAGTGSIRFIWIYIIGYVITLLWELVTGGIVPENIIKRVYRGAARIFYSSFHGVR